MIIANATVWKVAHYSLETGSQKNVHYIDHFLYFSKSGTSVREKNKIHRVKITCDSFCSSLCFFFGRTAVSWVVVTENIRASSFNWNMLNTQRKLGLNDDIITFAVKLV